MEWVRANDCCEVCEDLPKNFNNNPIEDDCIRRWCWMDKNPGKNYSLALDWDTADMCLLHWTLN